jgi:hypothetical protein
MYIDIVPNRQSPPAVLLRESYREQGKVKKRTLANLSKLPREVIEHLRQALAGQAMAVKETICGAIYGRLFVLRELARQCGIQEALGDSRMAQLVLFLVLARIGPQGSRLSALRWALDHAVQAVLGLSAFTTCMRRWIGQPHRGRPSRTNGIRTRCAAQARRRL